MLLPALVLAASVVQLAASLVVHDQPAPAPAASSMEPAPIWTAGQHGATAIDTQRDWDLEVSERGLRVKPSDGSMGAGTPAWSFEIGTATFGRLGAAQTLTLGQPAARGERVDLDHGSLSEWFVRGEHGVEHGWTIPAAPEGDESKPLWIGLRIGGDLSMHLVDDGSGAFLRDARGVLKLRYAYLKTYDATGRELPSRLMASPLGVGIEVQARDAAYPITVDPLLTPAAWSFATGVADSGAPGSIWCRPAGDVNGDGFSDIIVGAARCDTPGVVDGGRVWVFHGGANGPSLSADWIVDLGIPGQLYMGNSGIGDVNKDGFDDIAIGMPAHSGGTGAVYVWFGSATGLGASPTTPASADWTYAVGEGTGYWVQAAGDLNDDDYDDFVTGSVLEDNGSTVDAGAVRVFFGSGTVPQMGRVLRGAFTNGGFGQSCAGAGDMNADGIDDLVIGEPGYDGSTITDQGRVHMFLGVANFATATLTTQTVNNSLCNGCALGSSVDAAGDLNGDGYADVVVGVPGSTDDTWREGAIHLLKGGISLPTDSTPMGYFQSNGYEGRLGTYVSCAGDLDGDGFSDVIASANGIGSGHAYAVFGGTSVFTVHAGPGDQEIAVYPGGSQSGQPVAGAGDVNGDGFGDVLIGAPYHPGTSSNEGKWFLYFGTPNPETAVSHTLMTPGQLQPGTTSSRTGRAVSSAGDVNADGFNDIVVGSPEFGATNNGRVQVFLGSVNGPNLASPFWTFDSANTGEQLGWSVSAGDIDNDGKSDIVVGAPNYSNGETDEGRVYLFRSLVGSISPTPTWSSESNAAGALFGNAVSALGDVNADGFSDITVGAPGATSGQGSVTVFHGRATAGLASIMPAITITSGIAGSEFGTSLALVGDIDLNGFGDLAVGAPKIDNGQTDEGRVYVYFGSYTGITNNVADQDESNQPGALLGSSMAQCGDINGDGRAEILVGAPGYDAATNGGAAILYQNQSLTPGVLNLGVHYLRTGFQVGSQFGFAVSAGGDVNGDGWNDVLVGAPDFDGAFSNHGRVYIYLGSSSGLAATPSEAYDGPAADARFGESIALGGDVNGDGLSDPIGGVPSLNNDGGGVIPFVASGITASRVSSMQQRGLDDYQAIQILGRVNEVSQFQINLGVQTSGGNTATSMGRARVKLEWEIQPVGSNLSGSAIQEQFSFVDSGALGGGLRLTQNLTGLVNGIAYHWRARTVVRNPYYPHTRWTTIQLDGLQEKKLGLSTDCNGNGVGDVIDIRDANDFMCGSSLISTADCNGNEIPDECDTASGSSDDCNMNCVPDECELFFDCNGNGRPDDCDPDCNANFNPDDCDITSMTSQDSNVDLVPDECQTAPMNVTLFCFGDGTGAACPCGNSSPTGNEEGCLSSLAVGGRLRATGIARVLAPYDNFTLVGTQMPNSSALYFQGTAEQLSGNGSPFGDGKRCASGAILRLGTKINAGNTSQYPALGDPPISIRGALPAPGGTRYYQGWYRNAAAFCTANTFNLTNGLRVTWIP